MTRLNEMIEIIKAENPDGLRVGSDETGYTNLNTVEYEAQITEWAEHRLADETKALQIEADAAIKTALLTRLGITEKEAVLLLGGTN
jgi:hypothetical protein